MYKCYLPIKAPINLKGTIVTFLDSADTIDTKIQWNRDTRLVVVEVLRCIPCLGSTSEVIQKSKTKEACYTITFMPHKHWDSFCHGWKDHQMYSKFLQLVTGYARDQTEMFF